jgi:hypothetical protein
MTTTLPRFLLLATCGWLVALGAAASDAPDDPNVELRREFVAAHAAAEAGRPPPEDGDSEALRAYVLYPYVEAARLRAALRSGPSGSIATATDSAARAFLERHGVAPYTRSLRYALLIRLAEARRWGDFLEVYATASNPDQLLRCRAIEARIALGRRDGLAEAITAEWLTAKSVPDACDAGFDWLRAQGRLDDALVERRARLALAAGEARLARWLARSLPEARARPIRDWATLVEQPAAGLDAAIATPAMALEDALCSTASAGWRAATRRRRWNDTRGWCGRAVSMRRARAPMRARWRCVSRSAAAPRHWPTSRVSCPLISTTRRTSGTRAPRCGRATGHAWRRRSRPCPSRCAARHAGATGRRAPRRPAASGRGPRICTGPW